MDKVIKELKKKFLDPITNKYYDEKAPAITNSEIEMMYHHAQGIAAIIEVEEYCEELKDERYETIEDEFKSAEKYYKKFLETRDMDYLEFMNGEIIHGRKPLLEWRNTAVEPKDTATVASLLKWHDELLATYNKHKNMAQ